MDQVRKPLSRRQQTAATMRLEAAAWRTRRSEAAAIMSASASTLPSSSNVDTGRPTASTSRCKRRRIDSFGSHSSGDLYLSHDATASQSSDSRAIVAGLLQENEEENIHVGADYDSLAKELTTAKEKIAELTDKLSREKAERSSISAECDRLRLEINGLESARIDALTTDMADLLVKKRISRSRCST